MLINSEVAFYAGSVVAKRAHNNSIPVSSECERCGAMESPTEKLIKEEWWCFLLPTTTIDWWILMLNSNSARPWEPKSTHSWPFQSLQAQLSITFLWHFHYDSLKITHSSEITCWLKKVIRVKLFRLFLRFLMLCTNCFLYFRMKASRCRRVWKTEAKARFNVDKW